MSSSYERIFDIPIGPQHPALKEPAMLKLKVDGEHVVGVDLDVSYNHRGIEKAAEYRTYIQNLYLIERICGICNVAQTLTYCLAVESLHGKEIPPRARFLRIVAEEISRINSHLLWLGVAAHEIGFDTFFMHVWLDREITLGLMEALSGNRITSSYNVIGGVRRDVTEELLSRIRKGLDELEPRVKRYKEIVLNDRSILKRTQGVGILSPADALATSAVGPTLRASGIKSDVRADDPYSSHDQVPFDVVTADGCDAHARILVRLDEILESVKICRHCFSRLPVGPILQRLPRRTPQGEAMS
ncbi:MAG: nickel-dependent hydrogenase large subunit, partial [Candidatus Methanomethylicaceae archaeon]